MIPLSFEVRCEHCGYFQLWGLEQMTRALVKSGKLRATSEFEALIVSELFRAHLAAIRCPECKRTETLRCRVPKEKTWDWADEVRCTECQAEIPPERVAAIPGVKLCIHCQRESEKNATNV